MVNRWQSDYTPGMSCYLLEDGSLLRTADAGNPTFGNAGGSGGIIEKYDFDGNLTWTYTLSTNDNCLHHDLISLPNGNILALVWDRYTKAEAVAMGKDTAYSNDFLWSEKIIEIQPIGTDSGAIVWEWILWNHMVQNFDSTKPNYAAQSAHPELMDINFFPASATNMDWVHMNSVDYNPELDQIVVSCHTFSEIWIIDHSTSTAEAATHTGGHSGKGGDLLYRWGNPRVYARGAVADKKFYGQHNAKWIKPGFPNARKIIVFNNGLNRPGGAYSSIDIISPPLDSNNGYTISPTLAFAPLVQDWIYTAPTPTDFYSSNISGVWPIENGSFMITTGAKGVLFEIDSNKNTVWKYINPVSGSGILSQGAIPATNLVFRCDFYPPNYAGLAGQALTPQGEIELNPTVPSICDIALAAPDKNNAEIESMVYPNPSGDVIFIQSKANEEFNMEITDEFGRIVLQASHQSCLNISDLSKGIYFLKLSNLNQKKQVFKVVK